jgi:hypothetical protein
MRNTSRRWLRPEFNSKTTRIYEKNQQLVFYNHKRSQKNENTIARFSRIRKEFVIFAQRIGQNVIAVDSYEMPPLSSSWICQVIMLDGYTQIVL